MGLVKKVYKMKTSVQNYTYFKFFIRFFVDRLDESRRSNDINVSRARRGFKRPIQCEPRKLQNLVFTHQRRGRNRQRLLHVSSKHDRNAKANRLFGHFG